MTPEAIAEGGAAGGRSVTAFPRRPEPGLLLLLPRHLRSVEDPGALPGLSLDPARFDDKIEACGVDPWPRDRGSEWLGRAAHARSQFSDQGLHFLFEAISQCHLLDFEIVMRLEVQPESRRRSKVSSQSQSRVGRDRTLPMHNFIYTTRINTDVLRQPILGNLQRLEKLLKEDFARMNRWKLSFSHHLLPHP